VIIRPMTPEDFPFVEKLHGEQNYELPNPFHPLAIVKECAIDEQGTIRGAGIARLELNVTLVLDHHQGTPYERFKMIEQLQGAMHAKASAFGLDQAYAEVSPRWGKRLEGLGWQQAKNKLYFLRIN
jgi:hypothetical protein